MKHFSQKLINTINNEIHIIDSGQDQEFKKYSKIISLLEKAFDKLKRFISEYQFQSEQEEIQFFKSIKPEIFCKLIYYREIYNIEIGRPLSSYSAQRIYLEKEQENLKIFFDKNIEFIQYYRSGSTILDEYYFTRGKNNLELNLEVFYFERDPAFSTNYDFKVAKLLANDLLAVYLNYELMKIQHREDIQKINILEARSNDTWTDNKNALVELIYALYVANSINNGKIELKILAAKFERMFNIELGDIYRVFLEIRGRKGIRTVYLSRLIDELNKRMDEADNK